MAWFVYSTELIKELAQCDGEGVCDIMKMSYFDIFQDPTASLKSVKKRGSEPLFLRTPFFHFFDQKKHRDFFLKEAFSKKGYCCPVRVPVQSGGAPVSTLIPPLWESKKRTFSQPQLLIYCLVGARLNGHWTPFFDGLRGPKGLGNPFFDGLEGLEAPKRGVQRLPKGTTYETRVLTPLHSHF